MPRMANKEPEDRSSLELNLGFGRRRKKAKPPPPTEPDTSPAPQPPTEPEPLADTTPEPAPVAPADSEPEEEQEPGHRGEPNPGLLGRLRARGGNAGDESETGSDTLVTGPVAGPEPEPVAPAPRRWRSLPRPPGLVAAVVTGLLVGLLTVGLTWAGEQGCTLLRHTTSCGGPGFFLIVVILLLLAFLGAVLLRVWQVPDPTSTSFLGVGLLAVLAILFLASYLLDWWMAIAIPLIAAVSFAVAHRITTAIVDIEDERHR